MWCCAVGALLLLLLLLHDQGAWRRQLGDRHAGHDCPDVQAGGVYCGPLGIVGLQGGRYGGSET